MPFLAAVGTDEVEVMPVGGDFGPEVGDAGEGFQIKELVFDEAVNGFDVTLPGVTFGGDIAVVRTQGADGGGETPFQFVFQELRTIIGLPGEFGQIDAMAYGMAWTESYSARKVRWRRILRVHRRSR